MVGDYSNPTEKTQRKLNTVAAGLVEGKTGKDALISAGYSPSNRKAIVAVKKTLAECLDNMGLTDDELARRIEEATKCSMPLSFRGELTGGEVPDWKARIRALELCATVKGHQPGKEFSNSYDRPLNIQVHFGGYEGGTPLAREGAGFTVNLPPKDPEQLPPGPDKFTD